MECAIIMPASLRRRLRRRRRLCGLRKRHSNCQLPAALSAPATTFPHGRHTLKAVGGHRLTHTQGKHRQGAAGRRGGRDGSQPGGSIGPLPIASAHCNGNGSNISISVASMHFSSLEASLCSLARATPCCCCCCMLNLWPTLVC